MNDIIERIKQNKKLDILEEYFLMSDLITVFKTDDGTHIQIVSDRMTGFFDIKIDINYEKGKKIIEKLIEILEE